MDKRRVWTAVCLPVVLLLGLGCKFYGGPAAQWVSNSLAGVFYEIFWCLVLFILLPRPAPTRIVAVVFGATCILEFLQLWRAPFLKFLRGYFVGRALIGATFSWLDFPHYALGCVLAWLWMRWSLKPLRPDEHVSRVGG